MSNIKFKPYSNCHPGEYWAIFINSEEVKYPRGVREILSFLILKDENEPLLNNQGDAYYSVIVCNKSKGMSPKSKVSKIKKAMLSKEEYDPINCLIELPELANFYRRKFKVFVERKNDLTFITKIQRPRDEEWENIEGEFDGKKSNICEFNREYLIKLYKKFEHQIDYRYRDDCLSYFLGIFSRNQNNNNILICENEFFPKNNKNGSETAEYTVYKKLLNFFKTPTIENFKLIYPAIK